jgi:formylglycine-generating enzyme required for sulfatase activity
MNMNLIRVGTFMMGSPDDGFKDVAIDVEKPQHQVQISKPFYIGACEVTQARFQAVMGKNPSHFCGDGGGKDQVTGLSTDHFPVENVSWFDAIRFCNKLSEREGKKPFYEIDQADVRVPDWAGRGYRLPTEAEWEYACRANLSPQKRFSFGDAESELPAHAWFGANSDGRTHAVGEKRPNASGLFDMHGNVWEWCWDHYDAEYYNHSPAADPRGGEAIDGAGVFCGGSHNDRASDCRSSRRWAYPHLARGFNIGFRVALLAPERPGPKTDSGGGTRRQINQPNSPTSILAPAKNHGRSG